MNLLLFVTLIAYVNIFALNLLVPYVTPKNIQFGVRIPRERECDYAIYAARHRYQYPLMIGGTAIFVLSYVIPAITGHEILCLLSLLFLIFFDHLDYFLTFRWLHMLKVKQGWFDGIEEETAVVYEDDSSILHAIAGIYFMFPSLIVLAISWSLGISIYGNLPQLVPSTFYSSGTASQFTSKSPISVLGTCIGETVLTVLILAIGYAMKYTRTEIDASRPYTTFEQQSRFKSTYRDVTYVSASMFGLTLLLQSLRIWYYPSILIPGLLVFLPMILAFVFWFSSPYHIGQMGSRVHIPGEETENSGSSDVDDDREWKGGMFDYNRDDPSILVAKRFGVGWTFNFANKKTWIVIGGIAVTAILLALFLLHP